MEKIQAAIAKARADRSTAQGAPTDPPMGAPTQGTVNAEVGGGVPAGAAPGPLHSTRVASRLLPNTPDEAKALALAVRWKGFARLSVSPALLERNHIVTFSGGEASVPFDVMRTRLLQVMRGNGWKRVAITSPGPSCGKSTLALNLGFSLGRQPAVSTMVLDMDLRRPSLARMLGLRERHHFARVLNGIEPFDRNAFRHGDNLVIATQSGPERHPAELMQSPSAAAALDAIEAEYEPTLMLCDLPPVFVSDDAMAVMGHMDAALIIAAAETTTIKEIDRCEREVAAQTNVIGVILNKCRYMEKDFGYDYYGG
jgi:Mrp family chromosome partitioning ATPase